MALTPTQIKFFADYIETHLGIIYSPQVYYQLEQRLVKVAEYLSLPGGTEELFQRVVVEGIHGDLKQYLLDIATNNETSFFRDPKVFQAIQSHVLPSLRKNFPSDFQYRFWCAASSFGQEPFSLSMLVDDFLQTQPGHPRISILGTDVAEHALKRCREAKYSQLEVQRGLPALKLVKAFNKGPEEGYWTLKSDVTSRVEFRKQNLLESFLSLGKFHVILCRYVLIYQDAEKKKAIVQALEQALHPKGFLVFGASESAFGLSTNLDQMSIDGAIIYQKKS